MLAYFQNLSMYRLMLYCLRALIAVAVVLSFFKILPYTWWHILLNLFYLIGVCFVANQILTKLYKIKPNYESQFITAQILTLIVGPYFSLGTLWPLTIAGTISMASKYLLAYKHRHIFNPAAAGVLAMALATPLAASWWVGNIYLMPVILIGGFLILKKLRWFHLAFSFLLIYLIGLTVSQGSFGFDYFTILAPMLFFSSVMLIEPLTAPTDKRRRIFYGTGIAVILTLLVKFTDLTYSLELSLLMGNLAVFIFNPKQNISLKLLKIEPITENIKAFWFEPLKRFQFVPGQFLEWSLPHDHPDSRGSRRWFTISASPTENRIMLTTKFAKKSSSFKSALQKLRTGDELTATGPEGSFVLPKNAAQKLIFLAGGIGITPFRSMIKYLFDSHQSRDVVLLYSVKNQGEIAFRDLFEEAKKTGLKAVYQITDSTGYINPEIIKKEVPDWYERMFYVSGPEPMVEAFEKMLYAMGVAKQDVKRDYFPGYTE